MNINKAEVLAGLQAELQMYKDRRKVYAILQQVLEKYSGKVITKAIEKKLAERFPEDYKIVYYREEPYERKIWIRKMHGSKEIFGERITLVHESFGREFSYVRYLDSDSRTPYIISHIEQVQATIDQFETLYPAFEQTLVNFEKAAKIFKDTMGRTRGLYGHVDRDVQEFILKHS